MHRRLFIATIVSLAFCQTALADDKKFIFKIKTKEGYVKHDVQIMAHDIDAAKKKVNKKYPGCKILNVETKEPRKTR